MLMKRLRLAFINIDKILLIRERSVWNFISAGRFCFCVLFGYGLMGYGAMGLWGYGAMGCRYKEKASSLWKLALGFTV
ncbi:hypothetical protein L3Q72_20110 [Vibrio sp. JC009]|uniref:hypothetical protein n=1 Tax=Vibrio sp. JC009 TaxID=2912314 RepID=UPI0023B1C9AB|nr:hypothetical protein [Vibrio sp. JC009]WED25013.1 hypothetical protein L3Q72_20110 [Vibrio sp. JC009]